MAENKQFGNSEQLDAISRAAAINKFEPWLKVDGYSEGELNMLKAVLYELRVMPPAQLEQTDCEYCHEDSDGYVRSIEKNSHAWLVRRGRAMKLRIGFKGEHRECDILFCPMCGRRLTDG